MKKGDELGTLVGQGMVFDTTNNYPFLGYAEINFDVDAQEGEIPASGWNNQNAYHALIQGFGGTIKWHYSDANLAAAQSAAGAPDAWAGYLVIERFLETVALGRITIHAKDITWTGKLGRGKTRAGHDAITREFRVNNDGAGNLVIYFD